MFKNPPKNGEDMTDARRRSYAFDYFNYVFNRNDARAFAVDDMKARGEDELAEAFANTNNRVWSLTIGWVRKLRTMGCALPESTLKMVAAEENDILARHKAGEFKSDESTFPSSGIANDLTDHRTKLGILKGAFDAKIDDLITDWKAFDPKAVLEYDIRFRMTQALADGISSYYQPLVDELNEVLAGTDAQLNEGYRNLTKDQVTEYRDLVIDIIDSCHYGLAKKRVARRATVRQPKMVTAEKQVKWLKFKPDFAELNLVSIKPEHVIGSNDLWVYNVKYGLVGVYHSDEGFGVKGTTLQNVTASRGRKVRKPTEFFKEFVSMAPKRKEEAFENLTTKPFEMNGRLNDNTVLVAVSRG